MLSGGQLPASQEVHSFDLVATAPGVVACNMAAVPLEDASIDAAIFCLALMGTDYGSFLQVLHYSGLRSCSRRILSWSTLKVI